MTLLLNCSQKAKPSNSLYFLNYISKYLDYYELYNLISTNYDTLIESIGKANNIVIAFPLYVDSLNSLALSFLDYIYDNKISLDKKNVYVIINCGFREGEQNITALKVIKNWCKKVNANYNGSILIGAGEIIGNEKLRFVSLNAYKKLKLFSKYVNNNSFIEIITTMNFLRNKGYCKIANKSFSNKGKKNGLKEKDLRME